MIKSNLKYQNDMIDNMMNIVDIKESRILFDDHYQLKEKIGGGGFSEVWLAHDVVADFDVALKIYQPVGELDETGKEDFRREFARLCGLNHSNIIHAVGFGIYKEKLPYLAMNVCKNGSAKKLIGNISEDELWNFIEQIASGLQYLHSHDIVHQDMKPDNVLINSDGQYLIIDFGISTKTRNTLRRSGNGVGNVGGGTPWYMSVESFGTESPHIFARDIWAFGATLYELMVGDTPFGEYGGLGQKARDGKIPSINQDYSDELKSLVYDCLAFNAWSRPDAEEILRRVKFHKGIIISPDPIPIWKKAVGAVMGVAAIVCAVLLWPDNPTINPYDEILKREVREANAMINREIEKPSIKDWSEKRLSEAKVVYEKAMALDATSEAKEQGMKMWEDSQTAIDEAYLYSDSMRVYYEGAEAAAKPYEEKCLVLTECISDDLRIRLGLVKKKTEEVILTNKEVKF